ncbi:MAG: phosphonate metabolism transcriptional regulator PhnF [Pseudomonadota bacterium]
MTKDNWNKVRDAIEQGIETGALKPGARLPTEPEIAAAHGVGRHSVRRALGELARSGCLSIEQGRGTFVLPQPVIEYSIGKRTRLRRNFEGSGVDISSVDLGADRRIALRHEQESLRLSEGSELVETRRMTLADGLPVSFGALFHGADRFPDFPERRNVLGSVSAVYKSYGIDDYLRARTSVEARPAKPDEIKRLRQHPHMPVMVVRAVDALPDGTPIAMSEVIWSAARVKFQFQPEDDPS